MLFLYYFTCVADKQFVVMTLNSRINVFPFKRSDSDLTAVPPTLLSMKIISTERRAIEKRTKRASFSFWIILLV